MLSTLVLYTNCFDEPFRRPIQLITRVQSTYRAAQKTLSCAAQKTLYCAAQQTLSCAAQKTLSCAFVLQVVVICDRTVGHKTRLSRNIRIAYKVQLIDSRGNP